MPGRTDSVESFVARHAEVSVCMSGGIAEVRILSGSRTRWLWGLSSVATLSV